MTIKPPIHGRDHRPGRSDPIPGVIVYEYENLGEWLYVETTGSRPGNNAAIEFETTGTGFDSWIKLQSLNSLILVSEASTRIQADNVIVKLPTAGGGQVTIAGNPESAPHLGNILTITDEVEVELRFHETTSYLRVYDDAGDHIMQLDNDGTLHLKAGSNIVMDL